jgi:hypothetical protein
VDGAAVAPHVAQGGAARQFLAQRAGLGLVIRFGLRGGLPPSAGEEQRKQEEPTS